MKRRYLTFNQYIFYPMIVSVLLCFLIPLQAFSNPIDIHLQNETVTSGQNLQFEAENSITADSNYFIKSGANVIMKAKKNTILLPEVWAEDGSRLHILFPPPVVSFTADRTAVPKGESATLSWSIQCADDMTITHIGDVESEGTITVSPTETTTYEVIAKGPSGTATATLTINIFIPPPIITLKALKTSIGLFESTTLVWTTRFADDAVISSDIGSVPINGEMVVFPKNTTTYTLTATGVSGTTSTSVTINHPPTRYAENGQSIQNQINNSSSGDIIVVGDGTYPETLDFGGKALRVISRNGPEKSTIDPGENGSGVIFNHNEGENAILEGFTIQNGLADNGGGIQVIGASPTIRNCIVAGNTAQENGGGIYIENGSPRIENTLVVKNTATGNGGGFYLTSASAVEIVNCTTAFNTAQNLGADFHAVSSEATITNAIFWNTRNDGFYKDEESVVEVSFSNIRYQTGIYAGLGNKNGDPKFRSETDYKLSPLSPCINAGSMDFFTPTDMVGVKRPMNGAPEMGAYECRPTKTLFVGPENAEYTTIQDAIDEAYDGETIMVLDSTYTGERNRNLNFKGKAITVKSEKGFEHCVIDCENKGRGFIFNNGEKGTSQLIGFTIVRGNAYDYQTNQTGNGGGIYVGPGCSPRFFDIKVFGCNGDQSLGKQSIQYGGGIFVSGQNANPTFEFCYFSANGRAVISINNDPTEFRISKGGGGYFENGASPSMEWCRIQSNTAEFGGGICSSNATLKLTHCFINNNYADVAWYNDGYGHYNIYGSGGGIYSDSSSVITLTECMITANDSTQFGGGIYGAGWLYIDKCRIAYNSSRAGGGLCLSSGDSSIINSLINNNASFSTSASPNEIDANHMMGGAIYVKQPMISHIINCTITDNYCRAGNFGGLYTEAFDSLDITNSIIWGNATKVGTCPDPQNHVENATHMATHYYGVSATIQENRVYETDSPIKPTIINSYVNNLNGLNTVSNYQCSIGGYNYIAKTPKFNTGTYFLTVESIGLIDGGTPVSGVYDDLNGELRYGNPDMGCFETPLNMAGPITIIEQPYETLPTRVKTTPQTPNGYVNQSTNGIVYLTVRALPENVEYQWYRNDQEIYGATSSTFSYPNLEQPGTFIYRCAVKLPGTPYSVWSDAACLQVNEITIEESPASTTVKAGENVTFTGKFRGAQSDVPVQWYKKVGQTIVPIAGTVNWNKTPTETTVTIENIQLEDNIKSVWFEIRMGSTIIKSQEATITIDTDGDGSDDAWEVTAFGTTLYAPTDEDTDHDGTPNYEEFALKEQGEDVNPGRIDRHVDSDKDGYSNYLEMLAGTEYDNPNSIPEKGSYYVYDELGRVVETVIAR